MMVYVFHNGRTVLTSLRILFLSSTLPILAACTVTPPDSEPLSAPSWQAIDSATKVQLQQCAFQVELAEHEAHSGLNLSEYMLPAETLQKWLAEEMVILNMRPEQDAPRQQLRIRVSKTYIQALHGNLITNIILAARANPDNAGWGKEREFRGQYVQEDAPVTEESLRPGLQQAMHTALLRIKTAYGKPCMTRI